MSACMAYTKRTVQVRMLGRRQYGDSGGSIMLYSLFSSHGEGPLDHLAQRVTANQYKVSWLCLSTFNLYPLRKYFYPDGSWAMTLAWGLIEWAYRCVNHKLWPSQSDRSAHEHLWDFRATCSTALSNCTSKSSLKVNLLEEWHFIALVQV